jgi:uncharacterized protein (DUF983 family)
MAGGVARRSTQRAVAEFRSKRSIILDTYQPAGVGSRHEHQPQTGRRPLSAWTLVSRALRRRCPNCGEADIFASWWSLRERCPTCGIVFNREEGFFLGAYAINLLIAEFLGMAAVIYLLVQTDFSLLVQEVIAITVAVGLPLLCYPFSRTLWMALDHYLHPSGITERQLRHGEVAGSGDGAPRD